MSIDLKGDAWHGLEIRNRHEKNLQSSGYKVRFASLSVDTALTANVIDYSYDAIGRLQNVVYADSSRSYSYDYDVAGNRLQEQVMIDNTGTPVITTTNWTYNNANQIATMQVGSNPVSNFVYDANGNLSNDGQLAYTWDRANRLTTLNNGSYNTHFAYDGNNNRVQQTIGGIATDYLLDIQPQLALVLKETTPSETLTYVHSPRGIHAVEDTADNWHFMVSDGLGSVRSQVDDLAQVEASQAYSPYGQVYGVEGTFTGSFGYTGEQVDESGLSYLRARYYDPTQATFASLDPFEGKSCTPMSLNGYAYVHGNPIMNTDPTGMMVAGRMLNMDTSGTSRILQSWSNALKGAFAIPSLSLVKSMNGGMCGGAGGRSVPSKGNTPLYRRGGGNIQQSNVPDCSCYYSHIDGPSSIVFGNTLWDKCLHGEITPCSASSSNTVYIPSLAPMPTGTSTPTATSTPIPSATNTPSIPSQGKMYPIFGTSAACYPPVIVIPYGGSSMSRDVHNAIDLVPSVVYEELNPWTNRNWIDWQTDVVASQCSTVYAATSGTLITSLRDDGTCCDGSIINSEQLPDNFELRYAHIDLNGSLFPFGLAELTTANVVAGQAIGTVRNWREETASSEATHIDIAVRNQFNLSDTPDIQRVLSSKV